MACAQNHKKDPNWHIDLIWKYLHEEAKPAKSISQYKHMDPNGELDDRHRVYQMLVDDPAQTNPTGANEAEADAVRAQSKIPWNQLHPGMKKAFGTKYACGSVTKITFMKYMGWGGSYPRERSVKDKKFDAAAFVANNLLAGTPVLARTADTRYGHHFVGIVGARVLGPLPDKSRNQWDFLIIDPWAGNIGQITYGGAKTQFLGIIREEAGKLKYGQFDVNTVGGHAP